MEFAKSVGQKFGDSLDGVPVIGKVVRRFSMSGRQLRKETFARWCNVVLRHIGHEIKNVSEDFSDGINLIHLYQILASEEIKGVTLTPSSDDEKLANIDAVLRAMDYQTIPCDKIRSKDVLQGHVDTIIDVLWNLYLRFELQITLGGQNLTTDLSILVLTWLQCVLEDKSITNLTTCWSDGLSLCKLVETLQPKTIPDYEYFLRENAEDNLKTGFSKAEKELGIPILITASDLANNHIDEQCMVLYFSYFMKQGGIGERWTLKKLNSINTGIEITTLNKNLNMGILFHKFVSKLVPIEMQNNEDGGTNLARIAFSMDVAKKCFGVQELLRPEDFQDLNLPRIALVAYLSQFHSNKNVKGSRSPFYRSESLTNSAKMILANGELHRDLCSSYESLSNPVLEVSGPYTSPEPQTYVIKLFNDISLNTKFPSLDSLNREISTVGVSGDGLTSAFIGERTEFLISTSGTLSKVEVSIEDPKAEISSADVVLLQDGNTLVHYVPKMPGTHKVYVFLDGLQLHGCPYECHVTHKSLVHVALPKPSSDGNHFCIVNEEYIVKLHCPGAKVEDFTVFISSENKPSKEIEIIQDDDDNFVAKIILSEIGEYEIFVKYKDTPLPQFPLVLIVNDPSLCVAHGEGLFKARVNEVSEFQVDARDAGSGILNMTIDNAKETTADVRDKEANHYDIVYTPKHVGELKINLSYGGLPIRGSPFIVKVVDPSKCNLKIDNVLANVGDEVVFVMYQDELSGEGQITYSITGESGEVTGALTTEKGTKKISFKPQYAGVYKVEVFIEGYLIKGAPIFMEVSELKKPCYPDMVLVTGDISKAVTDEPNRICIDVIDAGEGELTVHAEGHERNAVVGVKSEEEGLYIVTYFPQDTGEFQLHVKWSDIHVKGSPFTIVSQAAADEEVTINASKVVFSGEGTEKAICNAINIIKLDTREAGPGLLLVKAEGAKEEVFVGVRDDMDGTFTITYVPRECGTFFLHIIWSDQPIPGSPIEIEVIDDNPEEEIVNVETEVKAEFETNVESAITVEVEPEVESELFVTIGKEKEPEVDPSKVDIIVTGTFEAICDALNTIKLNVGDAGPGELHVVTEGTKEEVFVGVKDNLDGTYSINFIPKEVGEILFHVTWNDTPVPGSPLQIIVSEAPEDLPETDASKVIVSGEGISEAKCDSVNTISLDVREAGPGKLHVRTEGPEEQVLIGVKDNMNGIYTISYVPKECGEIIFYITWSDQPIPGSPLKVKVTEDKPPESEFEIIELQTHQVQNEIEVQEHQMVFQIEEVSEERKELKEKEITVTEVEDIENEPPVTVVEVAKDETDNAENIIVESETVVESEPVHEVVEEVKIRISADEGKSVFTAIVNEENVFHLEINTPGEKVFKCTAADVNGEIPVTIEEQSEHVYDVKYKPTGEGPVLIFMDLNGQPVGGFPITVQAEDKIKADTVAITEGLVSRGVLAYPIIIKIDSSKAADAELSAESITPSGAKSSGRIKSLDDNKYEIDLSLTESGRHTVDIFWAGLRIQGSPFFVDVKQAPDPSKVRVYGDGLKDGQFGEYEGKFFVQTKGAGPGTLTAKVNGPKGAFRITMTEEDRAERIICVKYDPTEPGLYKISVLWSNLEVPGSPFNVFVLEKEEPKLKRLVSFHEPPSQPKPKKGFRRKTLSLITRKKSKSGKAKFVVVEQGFPSDSKEDESAVSAESAASGSQTRKESNTSQQT